MIKNLSRKLRENKKKKGFTLIELLIVMAIMVILAAVAVPQLGAYKDSANAKVELAAAKNLHTAINSMVADGTLNLPSSGSTLTLDFSKTASDKTVEKVASFVEAKDLQGVTKSHKDVYYKATVGSDGKITIMLGTDQIYPEGSSTNE